MPCRPLAVIGFGVALAAVSLLAAGCGGSSGSPGVASIASAGTTSTTATTTTKSGSAGQADSGAGGGQRSGRVQSSIGMNVGNTAQGARFSACMRKHGITNFPDPNAQGVIQYSSDMGIDPNSPAFTSAQSACQKLLPNGGQPTPAQQAQRQQQMLAFSQCMRAHGIKDFPDPTFSNGHGGISIHITPGGDLNPNNPRFQAAQKACQGHLAFKNPDAAAAKSSG